MKKIFITIGVLALSQMPAHAAGTWTAQNSGVTDDLYGIDFVDTLNGWCVGAYSYILHTTDGGQNWSIQHQSPGPSCIFAIDMVNADTGYAADGYDWTYGWIYKTTNGGSNWTRTQVLPDRSIFDIFFIDTKKGWAAGGNMTIEPDYFWQYILKTTDGGDNWDTVLADSGTSMTKGELYGISFADSLNGVAVGYVGNIFTTNNGGQSWTRRSGVTNRDLFDVAHVNELTFIAVGDTGLVIRTTDGGATWDTCARDSVATFRAVDFVDSTYGWLVGRPVSGAPKGYTINTINGGQNWFYKLSGINRDLYGVKFMNRYYGWACGSGGILIKYYDPTGVEGSPIQNSKFIIQNLKSYPNPFPNSTKITYNHTSDNSITVKVYNIKGELVRNLLERSNEKEISILWKGDDQSGKRLPSGIYFCRVLQGNNSETIKLIKLK